jgi:hypothetical protein
MGKLMVGVQKDTQVTLIKKKTEAQNGAPWYSVQSDPPLLVTQVYASALAISYTKDYARVSKAMKKEDISSADRDKLKSELNGIIDSWEPLAQLVLDAAYEATLYAAVLHAWPDEEGRKTVVLTALGGGVFGNRQQWIAEAVVRAIAKFKGEGLDVVINEWGKDQLSYIKDALLANGETKGLLPESHFGRDLRVRRFAHPARPVVMYTE